MKLTIEHDIDDGPFIQLTEIYSGISIKTDAGSFAICQRDQGIEIHLDDGPWFSWQEKKGPVRLGPPYELPVAISDLQRLASFRCEHGETDSCDTHGEMCNSCWTRRLAQRLLRGVGLDHVIEPDSPPSVPRDPDYGDPDLIPEHLGSLGRPKRASDIVDGG